MCEKILLQRCDPPPPNHTRSPPEVADILAALAIHDRADTGRALLYQLADRVLPALNCAELLKIAAAFESLGVREHDGCLATREAAAVPGRYNTFLKHVTVRLW